MRDEQFAVCDICPALCGHILPLRSTVLDPRGYIELKVWAVTCLKERLKELEAVNSLQRISMILSDESDISTSGRGQEEMEGHLPTVTDQIGGLLDSCFYSSEAKMHDDFPYCDSHSFSLCCL